jgi:hypothetical protein
MRFGCFIVMCVVMSFSGCVAPKGDSCSVWSNENGEKMVMCTDGTSTPLKDGEPCTIKETSLGVSELSCPDGTSVTIQDGPSCTIEVDESGTKTLSCPDGSQTTILDGQQGDQGSTGADGPACDVSINDPNSFTLACPGSEPATLVNGKSCSVATNADGTHTIACEDGTSATLLNGQDGKDGQDGQDGQDGVSPTPLEATVPVYRTAVGCNVIGKNQQLTISSTCLTVTGCHTTMYQGWRNCDGSCKPLCSPSPCGSSTCDNELLGYMVLED